MAKTAVATVSKDETKDLTTTEDQGSSLPTFLTESIDDLAGLGNSSDQSDSSLPFLSILQDNSPQVKEEHAKYVQGARPGYIYNTATKQVWPGRVSKGEDGLVVIPCGYEKMWVEWKPARGGWAGNHPFDISLLRKLGAKKETVMVEGRPREVIALPSGNILTETAYTFLLIDGMPVVLGASSTALGVMRDWMSYRRSLRLRGRELPSFAKQYRLQTILQTKDTNSWYNWKFSDIGYVADAGVFSYATDFAKAVDAGEVQIGRPDYFDEEPAPGARDERAAARASEDDESIPV